MVRYHNSGTQRFEDTEHESVSTGQVGNNGSAVGVVDRLSLLSDAGISDGTDNTLLLPYSVTVADKSSKTLLPSLSAGAKAGFIFVGESGVSAQMVLTGGVGTVYEVADPTGDFTTTQGDPDTTNIYYDGSDYILENQTGGSNNYQVWFIG